MLRITIDAFSGRPNPYYYVDGEQSRQLLRDVAARPDVATEPDSGFDGLGFRGALVQAMDDDGETFGLPREFKIDATHAGGVGLDFAERLIRGLGTYDAVTDGVVAPETDVQNLLAMLDFVRSPRETVEDRSGAPAEVAPDSDTCYIERSKFNPGFWNDPAVILKNNCYNYASNWRTNTFAQPGLGAGAKYTAFTCAELTRASLADGCHRRFHCFPDAEKPRRLVALVVARNQDFHWYRIHSAAEGFWGHKPGRTAARNTDNSGRVIVNPETCDRGPYRDFCGYFYTCKSQAHRIR
ncbi:hypothetical protein IU433_28405 [Nocardia puris]|uniref:Uncharacterized protein n=1 Tax=Nocardia puris TaxID=208602 RepID=A0A366CTT1_9NOCA|nr:hypothetical protein [Nocardia puris]MBF6213694.1 hypothetical protein [Nocardia puris]MBF6368357.1 hypothetical protein [Nocardia puris]MBF6462932.1 hypothetical protein [Nocardia puris]RBO79686.1 hypothetical protein DFR74_13412 [Nocardia puris]